MEHTTKTPRTATAHNATGLFALLRGLLRAEGSSASIFTPLLGVLVAATSALGLSVALPATAGAYATIEGPPIYSAAPGLPDGRVYEQVSPADKNGNEAGGKTEPYSTSGEESYAFATANGNSVLFEATGPMGEAATPINPYFIATKNKGAAGWTTRGVTPSPRQPVSELGTLDHLDFVDPSADLSHVMFKAGRGTYALPPEPSPSAPGCKLELGHQLYLAGSDPFVPATWLERPEIEEPIEICAGSEEGVDPVGGTPDFSTVYFTFAGTLLPEDASRAPHVKPSPQQGQGVEAWGFYEDREGALREAGVLPDGELDPFGAVPAASGTQRPREGNEVSADGSRAFFVSPDPASCEPGGHNNCAADPPELYVRENGDRTVLVSRDTLLPEASGLPAPAPGGVFAMPRYHHHEVESSGFEYVFASPDGSQAFFQSEDQLTSDAPEGPPGNRSPKTYDFDVNTGALTYLPGVTGRLVETDTAGSALAFEKLGAGGSPAELELWSAGPGGGSVTSIAQLPQAGVEAVSEARMSSNGSVLVFQTSSGLSSAFNSGGFKQIYRYDAAADTLGCVSCPPQGVTPTGNAHMSPRLTSEYGEEAGVEAPATHGVAAERGIAADGDRIFFDTPDPLVPQDTNTGTTIERFDGAAKYFEKEGRDVYEWENGVVYLLSSGMSPISSFFLDNSENGDDVFFTTAEGLVPGDTDGAYDVYDVRVPHPGDNPPSAAVPCEGTVCQGPPNVPSPLAPPASATFSGLGNPPPEVTPPPPPAKPTKKTVKCKRNQVKAKGRCVKRPKDKKSAKGKK
jgi:hypothetical protein